jgi:hypothetical protein
LSNNDHYFSRAILKGAKGMLSRRDVLTTATGGALSAAAARAATFGDPDHPAEGAVNVTDPTA